MKLTDVAPLERWVALEKEINQKTGLDACVFDTRGHRISGMKNWANRLCPEIKATDKGQSFICAPAHLNIAAQAMQTKEPVTEECDAGLVKIVVPIFAQEEFVGVVGCCGLLLDEGEVESYLIHKITGIEEETIEDLSNGIHSLTIDEAESLSLFIKNQVDEIVNIP